MYLKPKLYQGNGYNICKIPRADISIVAGNFNVRDVNLENVSFTPRGRYSAIYDTTDIITTVVAELTIEDIASWTFDVFTNVPLLMQNCCCQDHLVHICYGA